MAPKKKKSRSRSRTKKAPQKSRSRSRNGTKKKGGNAGAILGGMALGGALGVGVPHLAKGLKRLFPGSGGSLPIMSPMDSLQLYNILYKFHDVCVKSGLRYEAAWGTLLGAFRNGGIIPWDDDVDVVVKEEDKERLYSIFGIDDKGNWTNATSLEPNSPYSMFEVCRSTRFPELMFMRPSSNVESKAIQLVHPLLLKVGMYGNFSPNLDVAFLSTKDRSNPLDDHETGEGSYKKIAGGPNRASYDENFGKKEMGFGEGKVLVNGLYSEELLDNEYGGAKLVNGKREYGNWMYDVRFPTFDHLSMQVVKYPNAVKLASKFTEEEKRKSNHLYVNQEQWDILNQPLKPMQNMTSEISETSKDMLRVKKIADSSQKENGKK